MDEEILEKIERLKRDSDNYLEKFEKTTYYTPEDVREWDDTDNNYSYEVGFNDALNMVLRELRRR